MSARPAAALTEQALSTIGSAPRIGARLPLELSFRDDGGRTLTLGQALGAKPAVLVFADYRCTSLCGPGLVLAAQALDQAGLRPWRDYRLVVVGLDADPPTAAASLRRTRLQTPAGRAAVLLGGGPADQVARAAGYRYLFDPKLGQFAHDTVIYAVDRQGRVRAAMSEFTLEPAVLRRALSDQTASKADLLLGRIRLLCHGLAEAGRWNRPVAAGLRLGGLATLGAMALGLAAAAARRRKRP